eukprot:COSAG02_NODE_827_length_16704_cov_8.649322_4_plen_331_part_00
MRRTPLKSSSSSINVPNNTPVLQTPAKLSFTPSMAETEEDKENATLPSLYCRQTEQPMCLRSPFHSTPSRRRPRSLTEMRGESMAPTRAVSMCGTEGWLEVLVERDGVTDGWRRRYVRLQQGRLFFYVGTSRADLPSTPAKDSAAVVIALQSALCATDGLLITVQCTMPNIICKLRASSLVEADLWGQDIKSVCASECQASDATACGVTVPTPERISRRRAFLALDEENTSAVMQCNHSVPPSSPITSDTGAETPVWASATHAVSANGSFSMLNPCSTMTVEASGGAEDLTPPQGQQKQQGRLGRLRKVLLGGAKKPEITLVGSATATLE